MNPGSLKRGNATHDADWRRPGEALTMPRITTVETFDLRFPTSLMLDGSDAMNRDPDYSAAYLVVRTDVDGLAGHGFAFTIGRGNEIQCMAIESLAAGSRGATSTPCSATSGRSIANSSMTRSSAGWDRRSA
jgi:L-fuconate dehydratase